MKRIFLFIVLIACIVGCNNTKKQGNDPKKNESTQQISIRMPSDFKYVIKETRENPKANSISMFVEINQKLTEEQLKSLSNDIKSQQKFSKVFISYTLPQNTNGIAWATAEFNPSLKIDIVGSTIEEEKKINSLLSQIDGNIIGCWYEEEYTSSTRVLFEKNNKKYMKTFRKKWQSDDIISDEVEVKMMKHAKGTKLSYKNNHGEYYVLSPDKQKLMFYNSDNNCFTTALPLKGIVFDTKSAQRNKELEIKGNTAAAYTRKEASKDMARKAFVISQEFVKKELKFPNTADFPSTYKVYDLNNNSYRVSSFVNAQNDLGVKVKTNFIIELKFKGGEWSDSRNWELLKRELK